MDNTAENTVESPAKSVINESAIDHAPSQLHVGEKSTFDHSLAMNDVVADLLADLDHDDGLKHLFVTKDFAPDIGAAARRNLELARRYPERISISTVSAPDAHRYDSGEEYLIERQSFSAERSESLFNRIRWGRWLVARCKDRVNVIHCGNIRPSGFPVWWAHKRLGIPYILYVNGTDLLIERQHARTSSWRRRTLRLILGDASGIVTRSQWCSTLTSEVMQEIGITVPPPVATVELGVDPELFHPNRDTGTLRTRWGIRRAPILLTVAPLVPHKGQDVGIRVLAKLRKEFPTLRYILVGEGDDEARLRNLAAELDVMDLVGFAGPMRDDELPEAYATSSIYLGLSRADSNTWVEGFGLAYTEASASGLPIVAGDSGGVRSAVRHDETGFIVDPENVDAIAAVVQKLLHDPALGAQMGAAGRKAVETYYNWERVTKATARFVRDCVASQ